MCNFRIFFICEYSDLQISYINETKMNKKHLHAICNPNQRKHVSIVETKNKDNETFHRNSYVID